MKKMTEKIGDFRKRIPMSDEIKEIIETYEDKTGARNEPVDSFILGYKLACDRILRIVKKHYDYYQ